MGTEEKEEVDSIEEKIALLNRVVEAARSIALQAIEDGAEIRYTAVRGVLNVTKPGDTIEQWVINKRQFHIAIWAGEEIPK